MNPLLIRLYNVMVLVACYAYFCLRGRATHINENPSIIIVFHRGKLGDMVCATPVFRAIRLSYPNAKIILLGTEKSHNINKALLEGNGDVSVCDFISDVNVFAAAKKIKTYDADYAMTLTPAYRELAALYLSGIKAIAAPKVEGGYSPYETKPYKILRKLLLSVPHQMGSYAPREYLRLLEPLGIYKDDTRKHVYFSPEAIAKANQIISQNNSDKIHSAKVAIAVGAGNEIKKWPTEYFLELIKQIVSGYHATVYLIGNDRDDQIARAILDSGVGPEIKKCIVNTCGQLSLDELKAFISVMDVFIGVDTGPIYIAEALNIATIDIVGPMDEKEQPPTGLRHKVVVPARTRPELHIMNARVYDKVEARRQVESITPEMVIKAFQELFQDKFPQAM